MTTRSRATKSVRPILAGSFSVDAKDLTSSSTEPGKEPRRHSVTNASSGDQETPVKSDGSLRKVSRWFRDFKQKMDPIKVKDRIRYSRASLVPLSDDHQEQEAVFRRHGKTATMGPRRLSRKALEKRFNSMEYLPATEKHRPQNIRKMKSFQFDAMNDDELESSSRSLDLYTELSQEERLDAMTEVISLKLNEREKLFKEILQQTTPDQSRPSVAADVKENLLASVSLANELTQLINVSLRPQNLRLPQQQQPTTTINITTPDVGSHLQQPVCLYVDSASDFIDVVGRLQFRLSTLLVAMDDDSETANRLKVKVSSTEESIEVLNDPSRLPLPESSSLTFPHESNCHRSSLSDSECFMSLINDLGDSLDD